MNTTTEITWIPVRIDLPEDHLSVLFHDRLGNITIGHHADNTWYGADEYIYIGAAVSHWSHLPDSPPL